jgi:protein tyrosine/serine phosphatase
MKKIASLFFVVAFCFSWLKSSPNDFEPANSHRYNFHEVVTGRLYRSAQLDKEALDFFVKKFGIKTIVNLRGRHAGSRWWREETKFAKENSVKHFDVPMSSSKPPSRQNLLKLLKIFKDAPAPVLVHCMSGTNRTGEAAAIWLLEKEKSEKSEALEQLSDKFGYSKNLFPAKICLIEKWQGLDWVKNSYDPNEILA